MGDPVKFLKGIYATVDQQNCSGFLKAVAGKLGILGSDKAIPNGLANDIIKHIYDSRVSWDKIDDSIKAADKAKKGYLVVAVLKGPEHADKRRNGHVAIVLPTVKGDYALVICAGSGDGASPGDKAVMGVWRRVDAPNVKYYATKTTFPELTSDAK